MLILYIYIYEVFIIKNRECSNCIDVCSDDSILCRWKEMLLIFMSKLFGWLSDINLKLIKIMFGVSLNFKFCNVCIDWRSNLFDVVNMYYFFKINWELKCK